MTGGEEKPGSGGTDPGKVGSGQQNAANRPGISRPQPRDMTDQTDKSSKQDPAIDPWMVRHLSQLFSEVVSEPLPKDMQDLLDEIGKKTSSK